MGYIVVIPVTSDKQERASFDHIGARFPEAYQRFWKNAEHFVIALLCLR